MGEVAPAAQVLVSALAAGAILAMIIATLFLEAFECTSLYSGLSATLGFLTPVSLPRLG